MSLITGKELKDKYPDTLFVKWIFVDEHTKILQNKDFVFKLGELNEVTDFTPSGICSEGGLYFCTFENACDFVMCGNTVFEIKVPDDASIWCEEYDNQPGGPGGVTKYKANKIIISSELSKEKTEEICLKSVKVCKWILQYIPKHLRTNKICLEAIRIDGKSLEYVPEHLKTKEFCLKAVEEDGWALEFVPEHLKTKDVCLTAVEENGYALKYVPEHLKTEEICLIAMDDDKHTLRYVPEHLKYKIR